VFDVFVVIVMGLFCVVFACFWVWGLVTPPIYVVVGRS